MTYQIDIKYIVTNCFTHSTYHDFFIPYFGSKVQNRSTNDNWLSITRHWNGLLKAPPSHPVTPITVTPVGTVTPPLWFMAPPTHNVSGAAVMFVVSLFRALPDLRQLHGYLTSYSGIVSNQIDVLI